MIIGFGHRSGVGKDTCARFLKTYLAMEKPGLDIKIMSFAWKLKELTYELYKHHGVLRPIEYDNDRGLRKKILPSLGHDVVELWIKMGNKLREISEDTWTDFVINKECDVLIIPDVRFPNEVAKIHERKGRVLKVINDRISYRDSPSDAALEDYKLWDNTIENNGTLKELNQKMILLGKDILCHV